MNRTENLLEALTNGETADIVPQSRNEFYLKALMDGNTDVPEPRTRVEAYLYTLCKNGTGSGGGASDGVSWNDLEDKPFYVNLEGVEKLNVSAIPDELYAEIDDRINTIINEALGGEY